MLAIPIIFFWVEQQGKDDHDNLEELETGFYTRTVCTRGVTGD